MELNSYIREIITTIAVEPATMVFVAAFGIILYMLAIGLLLWPFNRFYKNAKYAMVVNIYFYAIGITWIVGFVTMAILLLLGVSGLHLLAIWLTLHVVCVFFCAFNYQSLQRAINKLSSAKKNK
ncbi:hypothetical protein [Soonwooa sp.]|uniref:hypothetical protein n=1 Tax=Soonwooa sp. TaxID=1938592 RepID=UPI002609609C|nr:hypothetical protein [Soonwooa sp.]